MPIKGPEPGADASKGVAIEIATDSGPARVLVRSGVAPGPSRSSAGLLCLGHGAGGGVEAPDLAAATAAALDAGWTVALVEQPYRVARRRAPERAPRLDAAWVAVVRAVRELHPAGLLVVGGRSSGARVACRTANDVGAAGVVCLAFPLRPPGKEQPDRSRLPELLAVDVPCLVVQGERDPFGTAADIGPHVEPSVTLVSLPGDHSLRGSAREVAGAVVGWLAQLVA